MAEERLIDRIKRRRLANRRSVELPELDATLYFGALTTADFVAIDEQMEDAGRDPRQHDREFQLRLVIRKAELEDGSPAFTPGDLHDLMHEAEHVLVQRLRIAMYGSLLGSGSAEERREEVKNGSGPTETSETGSDSA